MKDIREWLDEHINDEVSADGEASVEQHAEFLRAEAEAAGYSTEELTQTCGGDIAEYIRNRRTDAGEGKLAGDVSPILTPGFNQQ